MISLCFRRRGVLAFLCLVLAGIGARGADVGPFFEPDFPFFESQVQLTPPPTKGEQVGGNFVVRGILLPLESGHCLVFDQELLRVAGVWAVPAGKTPVTLLTMAQISYANPKRKAGIEHPDLASLRAWADEAGVRLEPGAPGELELVV